MRFSARTGNQPWECAEHGLMGLGARTLASGDRLTPTPSRCFAHGGDTDSKRGDSVNAPPVQLEPSRTDWTLDVAARSEEQPEVKLPKLGEKIDRSKALALAKKYGWDDVVTKIESLPSGAIKPFHFDGVSSAPDSLLLNAEGQSPGPLSWLAGAVTRPFLGKAKWSDIMNKAALAHDLRYAVGDPGDEEARKFADDEFKKDLIKVGVPEFTAGLFHLAVRTFGGEWMGQSFSWAFAR